MNLKERGITIGDLLIILIIVISTAFIINKNKSNDNQAYFNNATTQMLTAEKY